MQKPKGQAMADYRRLMNSPRVVDIDITSRCNLRCLYCFHLTSPADTRSELRADQWDAFLEECGDASVMSVTIGGGEPFIREDLPDIIASVVKNRMRFSILSNGGLITPDIASYIRSTGRCDYVQISVDGSTPAVHDRLRGRGSFDGAIRGIRTLQQAGVPVTSRVTIHRYNLTDLDNIARLLLDDLGIASISTNSVGHLGRAREFESEVQLSPAEMCDAMERILILAQQYEGRITAQAGPLSLAQAYQEMEDARQEGREILGRGYLTGCGCMWQKISVRPDGMYVPCGMLSHITIGDIATDSLLDIWQNHPDLQELRRRYQIPLSQFPECAACEYRMTCTGNCPAGAYTRTGEINVPSPEGCLKKFLSGGGRIIRVAGSDKVWM